jgi:hypothetical protein
MVIRDMAQNGQNQREQTGIIDIQRIDINEKKQDSGLVKFQAMGWSI